MRAFRQWSQVFGREIIPTIPVTLQEATPEPEDKEGRRRLEDEPLLAARIVVEECLNVVLDLDDIDRLWVNAPGARTDKADLQKRRSNLLEVHCCPLTCCLLNHQGDVHPTHLHSLHIPKCASLRPPVTATFRR